MSHFRPIATRLAPFAALNTLFIPGDFGEDRPQKKKISAAPRQ
jgi:hypothetical protein